MASSPLRGSERSPVAGARMVGPCVGSERFEVSVLLRRRAAAEFDARVRDAGAPRAPCLTREAFAERHGADSADIERARAFAVAHGLAVVDAHAGRRTVVLSGNAQQFCAAFGVALNRFQHAGGTYRGRTGAVQLPDTLREVVVAVLGLDNRPQAKPHFRIQRPHGNVRWRRAQASTAFSPLQVGELYGFPPGDGSGECVALIELGGGYRPEDLDVYFKGLGLASPEVTTVSVDHAANAPSGDANGPDGEVMLDIEVVGALAPKAKIAVYFAPNTDAGFLDAISTAVHDTDNRPTVISISWGGPESSWTSQAMTAMDEAFQAAATLGVTVCVASGDNGSSDGVDDGAGHVDFPSSSPFALACGGTSLTASGGRIGAEAVWNDGTNGGATGGGVSVQFALPDWQSKLVAIDAEGAGTPLDMRGVPDVAGDADPETGYEVRIDGTSSVIGGTSAVAPLWSALIARLNQGAAQPLGYLNPRLYGLKAGFRDIVRGNNGEFAAAKGWDACTGLGSPDGAALASALGVKGASSPPATGPVRQ